MTTGKKIAGARKEKGLTQERLSELLNVTPRQSVHGSMTTTCLKAEN